MTNNIIKKNNKEIGKLQKTRKTATLLKYLTLFTTVAGTGFAIAKGVPAAYNSTKAFEDNLYAEKFSEENAFETFRAEELTKLYRGHEDHNVLNVEETAYALSQHYLFENESKYLVEMPEVKKGFGIYEEQELPKEPIGFDIYSAPIEFDASQNLALVALNDEGEKTYYDNTTAEYATFIQNIKNLSQDMQSNTFDSEVFNFSLNQLGYEGFADFQSEFPNNSHRAGQVDAVLAGLAITLVGYFVGVSINTLIQQKITPSSYKRGWVDTPEGNFLYGPTSLYKRMMRMTKEEIENYKKENINLQNNNLDEGLQMG